MIKQVGEKIAGALFTVEHDDNDKIGHLEKATW